MYGRYCKRKESKSKVSKHGAGEEHLTFPGNKEV